MIPLIGRPKKLEWSIGVGAILVLALLLPIGTSGDSSYIYAKGFDYGIWKCEGNFDSFTLVLPNTTHDPQRTLTGRLDRLSANFWSASASVNGSKLFTWGIANTTGQGIASPNITGVALVHDFHPAKIVQLDSGDTFSMVLLDNGTLYSWGSNTRPTNLFKTLLPCDSCFLGRSAGELEFELGEVDRSPLSSGDKIIVKVVVNSVHTLFLTSMGNVYAFGSNYFFGLGNSPKSLPSASIATLVDTGAFQLAKVIDITSHRWLTYLLLDDGSYLCYGQKRLYCTGNATSGSGLVPTPEHFRPPPEIGRITRLKTIGMATYAWDAQGDIWVWGNRTSIPSIGTQSPLHNCSSDEYDTICAPRKLPLIPNSGKFVELGHVDELAVIGMTERYDVWIWCIVGYAANICEPGEAWVPFNFPYQKGFVPNIGALLSSRVFIGSYLKETPCYPSSPPFPDPDFVCSGGVWTLFSPSTSINSSITVQSPISIRGNLTIDTPRTIEIHTGSGGGIGGGNPPFISLEGCLLLDSDLSLDVDLAHQTLGTPKKGETYPFGKETIVVGLIEMDSNCATPSLDSMHVTFKKPRSGPSCKKYKLGQTKVDESATGRRTLNMMVVVDSSGCNTWWIAVSASVGGVTLIAIALALIMLRVRKHNDDKKLRMTD